MSGDYKSYLEGQQHKGNENRTGLTEIGLLAAGVTAVGLGVGTSQGRSIIREASISASGAASRFGQTSFGSTLKDVGMGIKAVDHALDNRSLISHLKNPSRYETRFNNSIAKSIQARNRTLQTPLKGQSTLAEEMVYKLESDVNMYANEIKRSMRYESVKGELKNKLPSHLFDTAHAMLNQQDSKFFGSAGAPEIERLMNQYSKPSKESGLHHQLKFSDDKEKKNFFDSVLGAVKAYQPEETINAKEFEATLAARKKDLYGGLQKNLKQKEGKYFGKDLQALTWGEALRKNLLDKDSIRRPVVDKDGKSLGIHEDANIAKEMRRLTKENPDFNNLILDPHLLVDKKGNLHDYRATEKGIYNALTGIRDNVEVPFLRFNPLDLMHWTTYQSVREAPNNYIFKRGNIDVTLSSSAKTMPNHPLAHNQDAAATPLDRSYFYAGGQVKDLLSGEVIKDNVYLGSARFGMLPRALAGVGNLHNQDYSKFGSVKKLFGFGMQEQESVYKRLASGFTKFADEDWGPNAVARLFGDEMKAARALKNEDAQARIATEVYKKVHSDLDTHSKALSDDVVGVINNAAKQAYGDVGIDLTKLDTDEEVMNALGRIANTMKSGESLDDDELSGLIGHLNASYVRNPVGFVNDKRILSDASPILAGMSDLFDVSQTQLITNIEDARRLVHQHAIKQIDKSTNVDVTVQDLIREAIQGGSLKKGSMDEVSDLEALSKVRGYWGNIYKGNQYESNEVAREFAENMWKGQESGFLNQDALSIASAVNRHSSPWSLGPGDKPPEYFGQVGYLAVNKAKGGRHALESYNEMIEQGISPLKAGVKSATEILTQPFAGRNNIDNFTTASLPFYYSAERLDNALSRAGLGLPQSMRGSMQSILTNQFGRRIVLPYAGMQQAMYFDGLTGDMFSDGLADGYANMHEDASFFKDITGLNSVGKYLSSLTPGGELFWDTPVGSVLKHGSFGLLGDTRSSEEVREYYESGEDPVRKGRFWSIGSNTPWQGGKIDYYAPNWYRRMKSDYKFTDTMYGSESEYWSNHWMPTLTNPLAPIRHFLTDSDHYEKKHAEDRPYAITGGFAELQMIPLIGPALDNTVGRIFKPRTENPELERAHRQYLKEINEGYAARYEGATSGGYMQTMPAGGYEVTASGGSYGIPGGSFGPTTGGTGGGMGGSASINNLTSINEGIAARGASPAPSITSLDSLRDPDIVADLSSVASSSGLGSTVENMYYSMTEMAGIYGFSLNTMMGHDEANRSLVLDPSSRMMSYSRAWWDLELGGLGGDLSEIGRRYNPRDKGNYYNPIRNTMPEWMPGLDYFIDFQHGDPYTKVKKGEMRLPGEAYEALNQLHPDEFGTYGAFDRFKILADVAPHSDQYKFYRRAMSQMNQQGMLTEPMKDEYATIRDQVTEKGKKYRFFDRKFTTADVKKETVTITKMLDANTFLTQEYGANPIQLAGISIPESATEVREWMKQYIHEGARVEIGLDADPLFRVRDDTMNTMRAVVYANNKGEGRFWYDSNKGQSVNAMLARRDFKFGLGKENPVKTKDDGSATSTAALYDEFDQRVGSAWETFWHDIIPAVPVVNVVADKFMQIKSPLEMYKSREVYGKSWQPWTSPIDGWIKPMIEKGMTLNPLVATGYGFGTGYMFGRGTKGKFYASRLGAAAFGIMASGRAIDEWLGDKVPGEDDYAWIPKRRKIEREIDEYFDVIKYMKYKGLYEKASQLALSHEGVDVNKLTGDNTARGDKNKDTKRFIANQKKWLSIEEKRGYADEEFINEQKLEIKEQLAEIDADRGISEIGPYTMRALQYKAEYESTLYGADPNGDLMKVYGGLPSKDKEFFMDFMNASPKERKEILKVVPENQKRFYQAKWGMKVDEKQSLRTYFAGRNLPGANWAGWKADVNLDDIKIKVIKNEGLETTEFGLWGDDVKRSEQSGAPEINPMKPSGLIDVTRIDRILRGAGLTDVNVTMNRQLGDSDRHGLSISMDLIKDRSNDIINELNNNLGSLV